MISLHTHTTYSFLDGYGTPEQYIERLKEIGCNTMAITDHGNIFGHRPFYRAFKKAGIKLIPGCEMYIANGEDKYYHLTVLAQNNNGYKNLCQLVSLSNQEDHFNRRPLVSLDEMVAHKDGLIILTGCFGDGMPHRAYQEDKASVAGVLRKLKKLFGDKLYLEVQHTDKEELDFMRLVGKMENIPLVATTDTHYPRKEDYEIEDVMLCIGLKARVKDFNRIKLPSNLWLMSSDEALEAGFNYDEIDATYDIAAMCDVELPVLKPVTIDGAKETMIEMIRKNSVRLGDRVKNDLYRSRYQYEMSIIDKLGLHAYFVVMADVIEHFKKQGVLVGPGRGSSGGSLICYLLGIIEIDPIQHDLKFERFMDLNRKDYPDIDTDFPPEAHDKVVKYLQEKFGHNRVGRLCSFTTYKGSSIFWDIARTHGIDTSVAKSMGKAIPKIVDDTTDVAAIMAEPAVKNIVNDWPVFELAEKLEGQIRQAGKHASGYAISPEDLSGIVATTNADTLSVDKIDSEAMGLLKLDILSIVCLDMMQRIIDTVGVTNRQIYTLESSDDRVFGAFNDLKVCGIFQFEGAAVRKVLRSYPVNDLSDLAFVNAVARPGAALTLDPAMIPPEPFRKFLYKNRYFVYQEELMSILAHLQFDWSEITDFRKLVSKKKVNELEAKYHAKFVDRCMNITKISWGEADKFWTIINRCGEYMFNKSHAVAYAMLAYQAMWLKVYYPDVFAREYFNATESDVKRRALVRELLAGGYKLKVYNESSPTGSFEIDNGEITGSLLAIKGIGPAKLKNIMAGKMDKAVVKAIEGAKTNPAVYAPWACLEDFGNKYKIGNFPEGQFMVTARVWEVKDNACIIEDINGAEKVYFEPKYVSVSDGKVYKLAITKFNSSHIDSARIVE